MISGWTVFWVVSLIITIGLTIGLICEVKVDNKNKESYEPKEKFHWYYVIFVIVCGLFLSAVLYGVVAFVANIFGEKEIVVAYEYEILSATDSQNQNMRIYAKREYYDGSPRYYHWTYNGKGKKQYWVSANMTTVVETNEETPKIVAYTKRFKNDTLYHFFNYKGDNRTITEYEMYVPPNTIDMQFNLDSQ